MREGITLACPECKRRNYRTNKNKKNNANGAINIPCIKKRNNLVLE